MTKARAVRLARTLEQSLPANWRRTPELAISGPSVPLQEAKVGTGIRKLVLTAVTWSMGGYVASQFLRIAGNLILTRVLTPDLFGIAGVATMVSILVALLSDIGLHYAIIQSSKGDQQRFLDTAWTIQVIRGFFIWVACSVIAIGLGYIAGEGWLPSGSVYATPELPLVIIVASFGAAISGFQSTKYVTNYRNLGLSRITQIDLCCQFVGILTAVILGWLTQSVWAFVASNLLSVLLSTTLSHTMLPGPMNRFRVDREHALEIFRFGRWIMFSSFFTIFSANGDRILLGNWASSTAFGLYGLAFNLVAMLDGVGGRLYGSVTTPTLSKIARENPERLRDTYLRLRAPLDILFLGGAGMLFGCGQTVVDILYDNRYAAAGPMLEILSFGLFMSRFGVMTSLYIAMGQTRNVGILNCTKAILLFTLVPSCYWLFGFEGALWAIALHALPTLPLILYLNSRHRLNSWIFESSVLLIWPLGYAAGLFISKVASYLALTSSSPI
jgi:O-antigen/teichoic acid export membrane protein